MISCFRGEERESQSSSLVQEGGIQGGSVEDVGERGEAGTRSWNSVSLIVGAASNSTFLSLQSAAAAPSPVLGNIPPNDGMPGGPIPPGFFQVCAGPLVGPVLHSLQARLGQAGGRERERSK